MFPISNLKTNSEENCQCNNGRHWQSSPQLLLLHYPLRNYQFSDFEYQPTLSLPSFPPLQYIPISHQNLGRIESKTFPSTHNLPQRPIIQFVQVHIHIPKTKVFFPILWILFPSYPSTHCVCMGFHFLLHDCIHILASRMDQWFQYNPLRIHIHSEGMDQEVFDGPSWQDEELFEGR